MAARKRKADAAPAAPTEAGQGPQEMKTVLVDIATLTPDPRNARTHNADNIARIAEGLRRHGQQKPIVVSADSIVIAGNGTLEAAKRLGWSKINVVVSELTGAQAAAYAISDNRTGETSGWDYSVLATTLKELEGEGFELATTGWTADEISNFIGAADWVPPAATSLDDIAISRTKALKFDAQQWERLVKVLGVSDPKKMVPELLKRLA